MKDCYCFTKSMYLKSMLWNMLMIESFKMDFHWNSPKHWKHKSLFPVSQISSSYAFYTFFLLHRPMCRALNERIYWLIEMNIGKTPQALVFSFIVLNLVEKAVLHFLSNMLDYIKRDLRNKQLVTSNADNLKGKL